MAQVKLIDINKSIHSIAVQYPEIIGIMAELGFHDIVKPGMLNTAGRIMTLPKGAKMKGIDLEKVKGRLIEAGFTMLADQSQKGA